MNEQEQWRELGQQLRVDSVRSSAAANSARRSRTVSSSLNSFAKRTYVL